jgi:hypothetical protein
MITLIRSEWTPILNKLKVDWAHKPSVLLIREVMKRELGFTTRTHYDTIYLDFYDEQMEILFRLKYL